jgi:hypothetical protein
MALRGRGIVGSFLMCHAGGRATIEEGIAVRVRRWAIGHSSEKPRPAWPAPNQSHIQVLSRAAAALLIRQSSCCGMSVETKKCTLACLAEWLVIAVPASYRAVLGSIPHTASTIPYTIA